MHDLDDPNRILSIRKTIERKKSLRTYYDKVYRDYVDCLHRCPRDGDILELGSGAGYAKKFIPDLITSDILPYEGIDKVVDATNLPFPKDSLKLICMMNVFHHISNIDLFLDEVQRCLVSGGRLFIVDHHVGHISKFIIRNFHHEPFRPDASEWKFDSAGPLSGANTALPWIVFVRDINQFKKRFPNLRLESYIPHTPLWYWLSGGLKNWSLIPSSLFGFVTSIEDTLLRISTDFGSFVNIEIVKE